MIVRLARRLAGYIGGATGKRLTRNAARHRLKSSERHLFEAAITHAVGADWIVEQGDELQPGSSQPRRNGD